MVRRVFLWRQTGTSKIGIATAQNRAATIQNVVVTGAVLVERLIAPGGKNAPEHESADEQQHERCGPHSERRLRHAWPIQHELAVACRHERLDLVVRIALADEPPHLAAQIRGDGRVGLRDALVQALRAADFANQGAIALVQYGVVESRLPCRSPRRRPRTRARRPTTRLALFIGPPTAARNGQSVGPQCSRRSGRKSRSHTRGVNGEMCLCRIVPSLPIRNVSGAPVTPQSIAGFALGIEPRAGVRIAELRKPIDRGCDDRLSRSARRSACPLEPTRRETRARGGTRRTKCPRRSRATLGL